MATPRESPDGELPHSLPDVNRTPAPSSEAARRRMRSTRQKSTAAEKSLCAELDRLGLNYEVQVPLPGLRRRADIAFTDHRVAVFVDGCFWHTCPIHGTLPKANGQWWKAKLEANRHRDADTDRVLRTTGWVVLRFWEHMDPVEAARTIADVVSRA